MQDGFSSSWFLASAKGPLADSFQGMLWDSDGKIRLCYVPSNQNTGWSAPGYDTSLVKEFWNSYLDDVASFHSYNNSTKLKAADLLELRSAQLDAFFVANHEEIIEFFRQMERREEQLSSNEMTGVESLKGQGAKLDGEVNSTRAGYLNSIDMVWAGVERDLNSFGAGEVLELGELNGPAISSSQIDKFIPWFDLLCGLALLVGFCTPVAAIATAGFLLTVCLTQFPGAVGAQPVYYQSIEMFALLVVAFAGGGKYLSVDSIINHYCKRCCGNSEQSA
tara:strand:- start:4714 stop:5547 length:834 start_codon:yes stop_codon:yes gene_type:complete